MFYLLRSNTRGQSNRPCYNGVKFVKFFEGTTSVESFYMLLKLSCDSKDILVLHFTKLVITPQNSTFSKVINSGHLRDWQKSACFACC